MSYQTQISFPVHSNSLTVYQENILPELSERQRKVLEALEKLGSATCAEVAKHLGVMPHTLSGRFTELRKMGKIVSCNKVYVNGRPHEVYKINQNNF